MSRRLKKVDIEEKEIKKETLTKDKSIVKETIKETIKGTVKETVKETVSDIAKTEPPKMSFIDTYTALKANISIRLKSYKNQEDEFCIIDRVGTFFFFHVFRDALFQYDPGIVLCERLFFKNKCNSSPVSIPTFNDNQKKIFDEFTTFSESLPQATDLDEKQQKEVSDKLDSYQKKIRGIIPDRIKKEVFYYDDETTSSTYAVTPLNEAADDALDYVGSMMSNFILSYFKTISYTIDTSKLEVRGVQYEDYVDIVVVIK